MGKMQAARCFIIRDDKELFKNEKAWDLVFDTNKHADVIILVYSAIDKRSKFYKRFSDNIVEFERLTPNILTKYIQTNLPGMPPSDCARLCEVCGCNYSRILLECDKIKQHYSVHHALDYGATFQHLLQSGVIYQEISVDTFAFSDAVLLRDISKIGKLLADLRKTATSEVMVLALLYGGFRNVLMYQGLGADKSNPAERTGLSAWQVHSAKEKSGHYSNSELVYELRTIRFAEKGIKTGQLDAEIALEYVLINIL
jgi:DNA polymerase III delta subunit